jgi:hypothetical protein
MPEQQPSIGRIVHYVSHGTPGGEYGKECRAAVVTDLAQPDEGSGVVGLAVLNPTGMFFNRAAYDEGTETPGSSDCANQETHGNPFRYCACGWSEAQRTGGTWHWPEQV